MPIIRLAENVLNFLKIRILKQGDLGELFSEFHLFLTVHQMCDCFFSLPREVAECLESNLERIADGLGALSEPGTFHRVLL